MYSCVGATLNVSWITQFMGGRSLYIASPSLPGPSLPLLTGGLGLSGSKSTFLILCF